MEAGNLVPKATTIGLSENQITSCQRFIPGFRITEHGKRTLSSTAVEHLCMEDLLLSRVYVPDSWSQEAKNAVVESFSAQTRKSYKSAISRCLLWHRFATNIIISSIVYASNCSKIKPTEIIGDTIQAAMNIYFKAFQLTHPQYHLQRMIHSIDYARV